MNSTEKCFTCRGTGEQKITVRTISPDLGRGKETTNTITCTQCDGKKVLPKGTASAYKEAHRKFWCRCKNQTKAVEKAVFWDDNTHPECSKHHWRCETCKKVVQVG